MRPATPLSATLALAPALAAGALAQTATVTTPDPTARQPVTLDLDTDIAGLSESSATNPFLDYRFNLTLTPPAGPALTVPGFFAGDGTGATATSSAGDVFRAVFTPDQPGEWSYAVSFRAGSEVAVDLAPSAGPPAPGDALTGTFTVAPADPGAPGVFAKGKLRYADDFYLIYDDGSPFIKGGADSPENWLGYIGFDNTEDDGNRGPSTASGLHEFPTHVADWNPGDPDWDRTDPPGTNNGRAIIGALNYLHSVGINAIYFLPMNIGGDAWDTWPYVGPIDGSGSAANDNTRFDNSKLAQWDIVFNHAQSLGIHLHFVLNEAEAPNKNELDNATLGTERKLFYREMIARFGYLPSIQWNISEEYNLNLNLGTQTVIDFAAYIKAIDPYDTPTTVHNAGNAGTNGTLGFIIGEPDFDLTSLQQAGRADGWDDVVAEWREETDLAGRRIAVMIDEPASPTRDVADFDDFRKRVMWDVLLSGGGGEWFINNRDQSLEDFREFEKIWLETRFIRTFIEDNLPVLEMNPDKSLVTGETSAFGGAPVFAKPGEIYAVYYPSASSTGSIDLTGFPGPFRVDWYNPRTGAFEGGPGALAGGAVEPMPAPPSDPSSDWAALVQFTAIIDCNNNTVPDADEILADPSLDCDANGVLDECQTDCNANGIADACEILADPSVDCDANGQPDDCQTDSDGDGTIDPCEPDCNDNAIPDDAELAATGGLAANFFNNPTFSGEPALARIDATVDFQWGSSGPGSPIDGDQFTSRWTGFVLTEAAGTYTFATTTNDGSRLTVDGQLIIDQFQQQTATEFSADIDLPAGTFVPIAFEHFQQGGTAVAELRWTTPGGTKAVIPASNLRPALDLNNNDIPDACDPPCTADLDADNNVGPDDLFTLLANFGQSGNTGPAFGDIDNDADTDPDDLFTLLTQFGQDCA